jgi:hypothetical protein
LVNGGNQHRIAAYAQDGSGNVSSWSNSYTVTSVGTGNLVTYGSFESGTTGWTSQPGYTSTNVVTTSTDQFGPLSMDAKVGEKWLEVSSQAEALSNPFYQTTVNLVAGQSYSLSYWVWHFDTVATDLGVLNIRAMLDDSHISGSFRNNGDLSGWKQFTSVFTATTTGPQTLELMQTNRNAVNNGWDFGLDNVQLVAIQPAAGTVPRITRFSNDDGFSHADGLTTQNTLGTVYGDGAAAGSVVTVYLNGSGTVLGSTTADSNGKWNVTSSAEPVVGKAHKLYAVEGPLADGGPSGNTSASFDVVFGAATVENSAVFTTDAPTLPNSPGLNTHNLIVEGNFSGGAIRTGVTNGVGIDADGDYVIETRYNNVVWDGVYQLDDGTRFNSTGPLWWQSGYVYTPDSADYNHELGSFRVGSDAFGSITANPAAGRSGGNYLQVNGAAIFTEAKNNPVAFFSSQNLKVDANSTYVISYWAANANTTNGLTPSIRAEVVAGDGTGETRNPIFADANVLTSTVGTWTQYTVTFNTGNNTRVSLLLSDATIGLSQSQANTSMNSNEFGIDDIQMYKLANAPVSGSILETQTRSPGNGTAADDAQVVVPSAMNSGNSAVVAGTGNDTIIVTQANLSYFAKEDAYVDGGAGLDTLQLAGADMTLDLAGLSGVNSKGNIKSVETIDLTGTGNNTLQISLNNVLDLGALNAFTAANKVQMKVDGNLGDVLKLSDLQGATDPGSWVLDSSTASFGGKTYSVYNYDALKAQLLVDENITRIV